MDKPYLTQTSIVEKFNLLLIKKPFDEVSVVELCEACKISRSTFYRYFSDLSDVVIWWFKDCIAKSMMSTLQGVDFFGDRHRFIKLLLEKKPLFARAIASKSYGLIVERLAQAGDEAFELSVTGPKGRFLRREEKQMLEYYGYTTICLYSKWLKDGMTISVEEFIEILFAFFPQTLKKYGTAT